MSPVIIKVSGLFGSRSYEKIVVSRVLGRVFVKSLCKFLFLKLEEGREGGVLLDLWRWRWEGGVSHLFLLEERKSSTIKLVNVRFSYGNRTSGTYMPDTGAMNTARTRMNIERIARQLTRQ